MPSALAVWVGCSAVIFLRRDQSRSLNRMFARRHEPDQHDHAGEP